MTPEENDKVKLLTEASDIFNYVVEHLRKQGTKSLVHHENMCAYRGDGGTMCAVGCLIADDEYQLCFEENTVDILIEEKLLNPSFIARIEPNLDMLSYLQYFHDCNLKYEDGHFSMSSERVLAELRERWNIK